MADIQIGKAPNSLAVLPFYGTAALFFVLLCILMLISGSELTGHYFNPHILAIVHIAALGWGTMIIFGAAYQLLPVIFERDLYNTTIAFISYLLLLAGTSLLAWSFWGFRTGTPLILAGSFVLLSALCYTITVFGTAAGDFTSSIQRIFSMSSALWLVITTTAGVLLAINLSHTFIPRDHLDMLKLHAHAGLAGWFLQLIVGVSTKLVPMFLLGKSNKTWLLYAAALLQNIGLVLFLFDGYFNPISGKILIYAIPIGLGTFCWLWYLWDVYRNRLRKKTELLMQQTGISMVCLFAGFVLLPIAYYQSDLKWTSMYATVLFLGWITSIILGKTFKTLPFIVWNNHYRGIHGKIKVPLPKQLYSDRLVRIQFYVYIIAFTLLVIGMVSNTEWIIYTALCFWLVLSLIYAANVFKILSHKKIKSHDHIPQ